MAVTVFSSDPSRLLATFKAKISENNVQTWTCDAGGHFTHAVPQWRHRAWFRVVVEEECLRFYILPPQGKVISRVVYGVYHGRLVESLLNHCDDLFKKAEVSALPVVQDNVRSRTARLNE